MGKQVRKRQRLTKRKVGDSTANAEIMEFRTDGKLRIIQRPEIAPGIRDTIGALLSDVERLPDRALIRRYVDTPTPAAIRANATDGKCLVSVVQNPNERTKKGKREWQRRVARYARRCRSHIEYTECDSKVVRTVPVVGIGGGLIFRCTVAQFLALVRTYPELDGCVTLVRGACGGVTSAPNSEFVTLPVWGIRQNLDAPELISILTGNLADCD